MNRFWLLLLWALHAPFSMAAPGEIEAIGYNGSGVLADGNINHPVSSADGKWVAFHSMATNLVTGDTNNSTDVFLLDRTTGDITRISLDSLGQEVSESSRLPSISADGSRIVFVSDAKLVAQDTNGVSDIYLWERSTGTVRLVSALADGTVGNDASNDPVISGNGQWVAFQSRANNLDPPGGWYNASIMLRLMQISI